jgi:hypothetical protein
MFSTQWLAIALILISACSSLTALSFLVQSKSLRYSYSSWLGRKLIDAYASR